jgi:Flp pilus assembly protein TadG
MPNRRFSTVRARSSRSRSQRGAAAVEFALVVPILVMLLFGITTAGLSYSHAIGVTNAVREGARFGATAATNASWASDVVSRVRATQFDDSTDPALSTTAVCVQLYKVGTGPSAIAGTSTCSTSVHTPPLDTASAPSVTGIASGTCVVRTWAARYFQISLVVDSGSRQLTRDVRKRDLLT